MKNPALVKKLLAELKTCTTNAFELHRVEVLEKDLLEGLPTVEIIDETHQKFNGVTYLKNNSGHFTVHKTIHRDVFIYFCGEIPDGDFTIHHRNLNPSDNEPANLQLIDRKAHLRLHNSLRKTEKICPICGKSFHNPNPKIKCCSLTCGVKMRSINHSIKSPSKEKVCPVCGKTFIANYPSKKYCSRACFSAKKKKTCPVCKKIFATSRSKQIYCSKKCANKINALSKKNKHLLFQSPNLAQKFFHTVICTADL